MKTARARPKASCGSLVWSYGFVSRAHAALHFRDHPAGRPGPQDPQDPQARAKTLTCWAGFSSSPLLHHSKVVPGRHSKRAVDVAHCAARLAGDVIVLQRVDALSGKKTCGHSSPQFLEPQSEGFQETVNSTVLQERDWIPFGIFSSCFKVLCDLVASH